MPLRLIEVPGKVPTLEPQAANLPVGRKEKAGILKDRMGLSRISAEIDRLVREYMEIWDVTYEQALIAVLHRNPELLNRSTGDKSMSLKDVGERVHVIAMSYVECTGDGYWDCVKKALANHPELARKYSDTTLTHTVKGPHMPARPRPGEAGQRIDKLVRQYMIEHDVKSYEAALRVVLHENRDLVLEYAQA